MVRKILLFLLIPTICFAKVEKKNIKFADGMKADGEVFEKSNFICENPNTVIEVTNSTFIKCNIINCILDGSNTFEKSNYVPEPLPEEIELTYEELEAKIAELEATIATLEANR